MIGTVISFGLFIFIAIQYVIPTIQSVSQRISDFAKAQEDAACGPVTDKAIPSPNQTRTAHLINQYCSYGFGIARDPYSVVVVGELGRVRDVSLGLGNHTVFETSDHAFLGTTTAIWSSR